jgi:hypothetical protein
MSRLLKAIVKEPGKEPEEFIVTDELKALQNIVDGYIEAVMVEEDLVVICDEEGRLKGKPYNCWFDGINFRGTIVVLGSKGENFDNCPISLDEFREMCE